MTIDGEKLSTQMKQSRYAGGRFERLENDAWVEWPVLPLDKLGRDEAKRIITHAGGRPRNY